jgi:lipopolysaccharide transport system ATP-binding protein
MLPIVHIDRLSKRYILQHESFLGRSLRKILSPRLPSPVSSTRGFNHGSEETEQHFWALKDVSFDVAQGDVIGILGRNGAGKSTLLKIISRITEPTEGCVVVRARMASLLEVGTGFHPELTGRENIFLNGAILGMRKPEIISNFDEIVAFAELEKFLDTPVKYYSSGMLVRLAFAVAAYLNSEVLVVDEVLAVGDIAFQKKCLGKMNELSRVGRTVLFVSHNVAAVENLCRRGIVLEKGGLAFEGTSKDAVRHYLGGISGAHDSTRHVIDLTAVSDRRSVLLRQLEFYSNGSQPLVEGLQIGASFQVRVLFELPYLTSNFNVGLGFNNAYGQRVLTAASQFAPGRSEGRLIGPQVLICDIPSLTLTPGEYSLCVSLGIDNAEADLVNDAARLVIIESDYYGTGRVPWNGTFVLKHRWYMEKAVSTS